MPYKIRKAKCKQSDGTPGNFVLSYTDKNGKDHSACHTSKKKAKGQIAAIEMESIRLFVKEIIAEEALGLRDADAYEKDHTTRLSMLYTRGRQGENMTRRGAFISPDGGKSGIESNDQLVKQHELTYYAIDTKPKSEGPNLMKITLAELRSIIRETIQQNMKQDSHEAKSKRELAEDEFTFAIAKAAEKGEKSVDIDGEKFPVKMSKNKAKEILGNQKQSK